MLLLVRSIAWKECILRRWRGQDLEWKGLGLSCSSADKHEGEVYLPGQRKGFLVCLLLFSTRIDIVATAHIDARIPPDAGGGRWRARAIPSSFRLAREPLSGHESSR